MTKNITKDSQYLRAILSLSLIITVGLLAFFHFNGFNQLSNRIVIRFTAQTAVILFVTAFSASSLHFFFKNKLTAFLLKNRALIGLMFGIFHTAHLISLFILQNNFHPVFNKAKITSLMAGGVAYFFMYLMMLTSFEKVKNKMNPRSWKLLHIVGAYWIWAIFFNSYLKNVINKDRYHFFLALLVICMLMRIIFLFYKKRVRTCT